MRNIFKVEVDGTKTLKQMIMDGNYDQDNFGFCRDQPSFDIANKTKRTEVIKLFNFKKNREDTGLSFKTEMKKEGFRPSTVEELLALGAKYPNLQRRFPVMAFGSLSMVTDRRLGPCYKVAPQLGHDYHDKSCRIVRSSPTYYYTPDQSSGDLRFAGTMIARESWFLRCKRWISFVF